MGQNLVIKNRTNDDQITIQYYFGIAAGNVEYNPVQIIQLPDDREWLLADVITALGL